MVLARMWRSIWRFHRLFAGILVLEYALTFAIVLTASGGLIARARAIHQSSGVNEQGLYVLQGRGIQHPLHRFEVLDARSRFAALVGESNVATGSSTPFLGMFSQRMPMSVTGDTSRAGPMQINAYEGDAGFAAVLGLHLRQGRWFQPDEIARHYGDHTHLVILSETLARRLFHDAPALGRQVDIAGQAHTVIGVMNPLAAPQYLGAQRTTDTFLLPKFASNLLVIRHDGPATDLAPALAALRKHDAGEVHWSLASYASIRAHYFRADTLTVAALAGLVLAVLVTALCGILGLTNYWVAKRRPQIAIRRALGARKRDIDRYFLAESSLLVLAGLSLGIVLKLALDIYFAGFDAHGGALMWVFSVVLTLLLATVVVYASLRRWQRMSPTELMRLN